LMVMARAGWLTDSARAAVPPSRIAERRAITPERLQDDVDDSRLPSLRPRADLTRIAPLVNRAAGRRLLDPNYKNNTHIYLSLGAKRLNPSECAPTVAQ
jgi:hypothetical protein